MCLIPQTKLSTDTNNSAYQRVMYFLRRAVMGPYYDGFSIRICRYGNAKLMGR